MRLLLDMTPLDSPTGHRGNGRYLRELATGLAALPAGALGSIEVVALTHLTLTGKFRVSDDLASFSQPDDARSTTSKGHYRWTYARRLAFWRAARHVGADAVHFGDPNATPFFMKLTSCRRILTCHDTIPLRYPHRYMSLRDGGPRVGRAIERRRYRTADLVIAVSEATRHDACTLLGVPEQRVVRVHNGVDVDRWAQEPAASADETLRRHGLFGRPFALYVGGPDWHKNIGGMMGGLASARARGVDLDLAWAGRLAPQHRSRVEALAREAGVAHAIRWLGYVGDDELGVLYRAARAHVLVSRCEGFGLTVVEAMASGCPVVTTACGSLREVAGDAALLVDPDDHAAIGTCLERLCHEPGLRERMIDRGRRRAPTFSRAAHALATGAVYRTLLEKKNLTGRTSP